MTIQEAIKSGKPFRREGWATCCELVVKGNKKAYGQGELYFLNVNGTLAERASLFFVKDLVSEDWIISNV